LYTIPCIWAEFGVLFDANQVWIPTALAENI
jgi:hypothetical protein